MDPSFLVYTFIFLTGACIGSFLNVCIYRIPRNESIIFPGSKCPHCGHKIKWYDNLPILGWFLLGGRCRHCKHPFSLRYPAIETLTALLFLAAWYLTPPPRHSSL